MPDSTIRVRIAPSPTGPLHIGTARTALFNYLFARHVGGTFVFRLEDTDVARGTEAYERDILEGLEWLGLSWDDLVRDRIEIDTANLGGDFVIVRADGTPLYNFVVVVDDAAMEISHVIRGEDHISNTPKQILMIEALGHPVPIFGHLPLIL